MGIINTKNGFNSCKGFYVLNHITPRNVSCMWGVGVYWIYLLFLVCVLCASKCARNGCVPPPAWLCILQDMTTMNQLPVHNMSLFTLQFDFFNSRNGSDSFLPGFTVVFLGTMSQLFKFKRTVIGKIFRVCSSVSFCPFHLGKWGKMKVLVLSNYDLWKNEIVRVKS